MSKSGVAIGVDVGGTFTDLVLVDPDRQIFHVEKTSSSGGSESDAVIAALNRALEKTGVGRDAVVRFVHGTTVATNALLERRLAPTGLVTSRGCRDLIELGRQTRDEKGIFDFRATRAAPPVPRRHRFETSERLLADGSVVGALDDDELARISDALVEDGVEAIAVCFLHSYRNPAPEQHASAFIRRRHPSLHVSASSELTREFREYERFVTAALDAALRPVVSTYLAELDAGLSAERVSGRRLIMQSNGGLTSLNAAGIQPVKLLASGPSAGVIGAIAAAAECGLEDLIAFDMGGTSTDASLVAAGQPQRVSLRTLSGYPLRTPSVDVHSIGAGGGSLASVSAGGLLKVGPESAGSTPGPACYGRGGTSPTVTDANLLLGYLDPSGLLGGTFPLDREAAERAIHRCIAAPLNLDTMVAARGIRDVITASMVRGIRVVTVERGFDPREFVLVAFGGAGPLHATAVARELGIRTVLIPAQPGLLSAAGLLRASVQADFVRTDVFSASDDAPARLSAMFDELEETGRTWLASRDVPDGSHVLERRVDMRYRRQNYELAIPVPSSPLDGGAIESIVEAFHREHERAYGAAAPGETVEFVTCAVSASSPAPASQQDAVRPTDNARSCAPAVVARRPVHLAGPRPIVNCPVYERSDLHPGQELDGPAIVNQLDTTTVLAETDSLHVAEGGGLIIHVDA